VEVSEGEQQLLVFLRLCAALVVLWGYFVEGTLQVSFETLRRLVGDFDTALEDGNWEVLAGHRCQPKAILGVHSSFILPLLDLFELWHPTLRQVTVLEANPVTSSVATFNKLFGNSTLTLAERDYLKALVHALRFSESQKIGDGIGSRGEHENDRGRVLRIIVSAKKIERGRLNELLTKFLLNEFLDTIYELLISEDLKDHQLLELRKFLFIIARKRNEVRLFGLENILPSDGIDYNRFKVKRLRCTYLYP